MLVLGVYATQNTQGQRLAYIAFRLPSSTP